MRSTGIPDPDVVYPVPNSNTVTYVKPTVKNKNIIVGDFTCFSDVDFEKHVTHQYDFYGDKLVIGKFCQIASGVNFVMNGANHQMNAVSTFPFYMFEGWDEEVPPLADMPVKGDTVVGRDVLPYTVVAGNPAAVIKKRFDDELIGLLEKFRWWDLDIRDSNELIPLLTSTDLERVKKEIGKKCSESAEQRSAGVQPGGGGD